MTDIPLARGPLPGVRASRLCVILLAGAVPLISGTAWLLVTGRTVLYDEAILPRVVASWPIVFCGLALALLDAGRRASLRWPAAAIAWAPLLGWLTMATAFGLEPLTSLVGSYERWAGLLAWLLYGATFVLVANTVTNAGTVRRVSWAALAAGAALAVYGLAQRFGLDPIEWHVREGRAFSIMRNPNDFAGYLLFPIGYGIALVLTEDRVRPRMLALASSVLCLAALVVTYTRSGWAGALITLCVLGWAGRKSLLVPWRATKLPVLAGLALLAALLVWSSLRPGVTNPVERLSPSAGQLSSALSERAEIWGTAIAATGRRPILGWGPDSLGLVYRRFRPPSEDLTSDDAHCWPLDLAVSGGVPAALLFLVLIGALLLKPLAQLPKACESKERLLLAGPLASALGYLAYRFVSPGTPATDVQLWLALGLCQAALAIPRPAPRRAMIALASGAMALFLLALPPFAQALRADFVFARALANTGSAKAGLAREASRLNPLVARYAAVAATEGGNSWIDSGADRGSREDRAEFDVARMRMLDLVGRFPNDGLYHQNLAYLSDLGAERFADPSLAKAAREEAATGLRVDPNNEELQRILAGP